VRVRTPSGDLGLKGPGAEGASVDAETREWRRPSAQFRERAMDYEILHVSGDIRNCMGAEARSASASTVQPPFAFV